MGTADLHAEGQVDPGAEGGADGPGREAQVFEELGEGLGQQQARTLLRYHHTAPHTRQVQPPRLETHTHTHTHTHKPSFNFICFYVFNVHKTSIVLLSLYCDNNTDNYTVYKNTVYMTYLFRRGKKHPVLFIT